ncbi:MAG: heavy-metal-associated domain-containing protein [Geovibrio sp.]|nr:heavy-metal-associated domain-containing protein [Geovibrio sp.]
MKEESVKLSITGMTCSACSSRIERKLTKQKGISEVAVNLKHSEGGWFMTGKFSMRRTLSASLRT